MTLDERLQYCRICVNRKMNAEIGLVCSLTNAKPDFDPTCPTINLDKAEAARLVQLERDAKAEEVETGGSSLEQKGIRKGVVGGLLMMAIAVTWFVLGYAAGRIFFYPPVLFCIGLYALIKGISTGNIAGNK